MPCFKILRWQPFLLFLFVHQGRQSSGLSSSPLWIGWSIGVGSSGDSGTHPGLVYHVARWQRHHLHIWPRGWVSIERSLGLATWRPPRKRWLRWGIKESPLLFPLLVHKRCHWIWSKLTSGAVRWVSIGLRLGIPVHLGVFCLIWGAQQWPAGLHPLEEADYIKADHKVILLRGGLTNLYHEGECMNQWQTRLVEGGSPPCGLFGDHNLWDWGDASRCFVDRFFKVEAILVFILVVGSSFSSLSAVSQ